MSKLLERAFAMAKSLPEDRQNEVGEMILSILDQEQSDLCLSPEQVAEVRRRVDNPQPIVSDQESELFFQKLVG